MTAYVTPYDAIHVHASGWAYSRGAGAWMTKVAVCGEAEMFAQVGQATAKRWCEERGFKLPTVEQYERSRLEGDHIEPVVFPTLEMMRAASVSPNDQAAIQRFREAHMQSREWGESADAEIWKRIRAINWSGATMIDNTRKYEAQARPSAPHGHMTITGWWTNHARKYGVNNDVMIQEPSDWHDDGYFDYGTGFKAVCDTDPSERMAA